MFTVITALCIYLLENNINNNSLLPSLLFVLTISDSIAGWNSIVVIIHNMTFYIAPNQRVMAIFLISIKELCELT